MEMKVKIMTYKEYIEKLKNKYVGKKYEYEGKIYKIVDVDYNGAILIDKKSEFYDTTAVNLFKNGKVM